jgi:signal transduction histidine kinase
MTQGLPRRLRYAFVLQAVMASVAIILGTYVAGVLVEELLTAQRMREEAKSFWDAHTVDPNAPLPFASSVESYFVEPGAEESAYVPPEFRLLGDGIVRDRDGRARILVDRRDEGVLYLRMSFPLVERVIFWTGLISTLLALMALYLVSWLTYRTSRRLVAPVNWLASEVALWDPEHPEAQLLTSELPDNAGTEVKQLGGALRQLLGRLREFVRREREFTRDASHELRTPLTVIRVATDLMLADEEMPTRARRSLARMQRAGRDMEAVIDAFLILARQESNPPPSEDFDVTDLVYEEVEKARPLLGGKPVELLVHSHATPRLHASPHVLSVMLGNLLSNACTFTETGSVEVLIEADRIVVRDSGIGMSTETLQKAHEPFFRANQFGATGKGMGLSIVRRLGERFNWPVTLDSVPGVGTTATLAFSREGTPAGS